MVCCHALQIGLSLCVLMMISYNTFFLVPLMSAARFFSCDDLYGLLSNLLDFLFYSYKLPLETQY